MTLVGLILLWLVIGFVSSKKGKPEHWTVALERFEHETIIQIGKDSAPNQYVRFRLPEANSKTGAWRVTIDRATKTVPFGQIDLLDLTTLPGRVRFSTSGFVFELSGSTVSTQGNSYQLSSSASEVLLERGEIESVL